MPNFEQSVTVIALATGPAGIWFGWWLSDASAKRQATRESEAADADASRTRTIEAARLAQHLASGVRTLGHGFYLQKTGSNPAGMKEALGDFNATRSAYRQAVLELRVLGPSWAVEQAEEIEVTGQQMTDLLTKMQQRFISEHVRRLEEELPRMDAAVDEFIALLGQHFNPDPSALPPRRDLEIEGRIDL